MGAAPSSHGLIDDGLNGLTYTVIGIAMAVHNDLGPGHRESTYHNALHIRLVEAGLVVEHAPELPIYDENGNRVNFYRPDQLLEYKAHRFPLTNDEVALCADYLAASTSPVCLLFNFGRMRLEWRRILPPKHVLAHRRRRWAIGSGPARP